MTGINHQYFRKGINKKQDMDLKELTFLGRESITSFKVTLSGSGSPICLNP